MNIKAILFDHDGTLADSEVVHYQFWAAVLSEYGIVFPESHYIRHYTGVSERNTARHLRAFYALEASVDTLVAQKRAQAEQFHTHSHYPIMPHVLETLQALQTAGLRMAVVSGSARFALEANLQAAGLADYFEIVASGEEQPENKPAPHVYQWALTQMALAPHECVAVEDTHSGLCAAKSAGLFTCVVPNRFSRHQDFAGADLHLAHLGEFTRWLLKGAE